MLSLYLKRKNLVCFVIVFSFLGSISHSIAASTANWGGVALSIQETTDDGSFPFARKMLACDPCAHGNINEYARNKLVGKPYNNFELSTAMVGVRQIEGVILSAIINRESVQIYKETSGDRISYLHLYRFFVNLVAFEFKQGEARYVSSRPVVVQYTDYLDHPATPEEQFEVAYNLYANDTRGINIFDELYKAGKSMKVDVFSEKYARVMPVILSDEVKSVMKLEELALDDWRYQIGQIFEASLIKHSGGVLIPAASEDSTKADFSANFSNASFKIRLPEPTYTINLDVKRFVPVESINGAQKTVCFIVGLQLTVDGPLEQLMDGKFIRKQDSCGVISVKDEVDPALRFPGSLFSLLNGISKQFGNDVDQNFIKTSVLENHKSVVDGIGAVKTAVFDPFN